MSTELDPTLQLHQLLLTDLDRRDAVTAEREAEARRTLEQALADCAAEHSRIEHERLLLTQVGQLYRRFIEERQLRISASCSIVPPPPPPEAFEPELVTRMHPMEGTADQHVLVDPSTELQIASTIREIRSQLIERRDVNAA
jgi:hypothetical protein